MVVEIFEKRSEVIEIIAELPDDRVIEIENPPIDKGQDFSTYSKVKVLGNISLGLREKLENGVHEIIARWDRIEIIIG